MKRSRAVARLGALATAAVAVLGLAGGPPPARAHHAWNEVDTAKTLTLRGTVKSLKWENPHASLVLVTDDGGPRVEWTVMMSGLARMQGHGIDEAMVAVGRPLVIVASPSRDEPHVVRANRIESGGKDHVLY